VGLAANVVENRRGDAQVGVEAGEAVEESRGAAGHRARVDYERDRQPEQLRHLGGAAAVAPALAAVGEAHQALDHRDVRVGPRPREAGAIRIRIEHPAVEAARGTAGDAGVVERVDEVGTNLERLHLQPPPRQRADQAEGDGRLADAAVGSGEEDGAEGRGGWSIGDQGERTLPAGHSCCCTGRVGRGPRVF
jgi:hypothetical protein